jgi:hypothetical protein
MGDAPARTEQPAVTTGPIRGSKKIHVGPLKVAMREIYLEPSSGEPPVRVYDTSGPYTDPNASIDISQGLPELRRDWILARGDVEQKEQRAVRPKIMASSAPTAAAASRLSPMSGRKVLRAKPGMNVSQMHYARAASSRPRWNMWRSAKIWAGRGSPNISATAKALAPRSPTMSPPNLCAMKWRGAGRSSPQHQPPRKRADGDRAQFPRQDQRQYRQQRGRI